MSSAEIQPSLPAAIPLTGGAQLRRWQRSDRDAVIDTVNANRAYLREWMPWAAQPASVESVDALFDEAIPAFDTDAEFNYGLFDAMGEVIGAGGVHRRGGADVLEIGYWVAQSVAGQGLGRAVARALTIAAAAAPGISRVEIRCDEANVRSAAIPRALGYELVDVYTRPPVTPGETDRHMVWSIDGETARAL